MAGIGLYGVYYSKATVTDGVLASYNGVKTMGKAISASFEAAEGSDERLWANNTVAETDAGASAGGTLTLTLDKLTNDAYVDLFGLTSKTESVTVGGDSVTGTGYDSTGAEAANAVGVAFIRWRQESNVRTFYEAVIYSYVTFNEPSEEFATYNGVDGVAWQTPELEGAVSGGIVTGALPWRKRYTFPSQAAAVQFITDYFAAPQSDNT